MYTQLTSQAGITITTHPLGATWCSCRIPLADEAREILLGHANISDSLHSGAYLGSTVGRYAGRIAYGRYGSQQLSINQAPHQLHGGKRGFSHQNWQIDSQSESHITYLLDSPDGEEGYPGNLTAYVTYRFLDSHTLRIEWHATTDRDSIINLTNHAYFNLNGNGNPSADGLAQHLRITADNYVPVDAQGIPSADSATVSADMDFRQSKLLAQNLLQSAAQQTVGGYDHSYLIDSSSTTAQAELRSHNQDLQLSIHTTQPAIHIYSGQYLNGTPNRHGGQYPNFAGIAIETQAPPDSPNRHPALVRITPSQPYHHHSDYRFDW